MTTAAKRENNPTKARLERLAWLMDNSIRLPGGLRVGIDSIIGLVPGIGDVVAAGISSYVVLRGAVLGAPASVLARMSLNVLFELLVGAIPVLGDAFDIFFRANVRNVKLLEAHLDDPDRTRKRSLLALFGIAGLLLSLLIVTLWLVVKVLALLWDRLLT